jgi:hypothetical protein
MRERIITLTFAAAVVTAVACGGSDKGTTAPTNTNTGTVSNIVNFRATMNGASENPVNTSTGTGLFTATLDTVTNVFTYDIIFSGLSAGVNNGHIHGPAAAGVNAGTTVNFNTLAGANFSFGLPAGGAHGQLTLTAATQVTATVNGDSLRKLLFAGLTYANIHTTAIPGGEIRGQILKQ